MNESQVVMITGATKGLGKALTWAFAKAGAKLAVSARGQDGLDELARQLKRQGVEVLAVQGDMANNRDVDRFVAMTEKKFGQIDVLINNASIFGPSPSPYLLDFPEEDFLEVLRINSMNPFLVTKRVLTGMLIREQGVIINVTSEAGRTGFAGWGAYGISKFALEGLTQTWADELDETGIRIYMVDPGEMDTDMHALAVPDCDYELNDPQAITPVFLYLASKEAKYLSGERIEATKWLAERRDAK
ncbi:SDR family oxidoreductase [Hazenella sp. IB182357]|uniref:SDR family oxidoreductase n=1 Tax=Polycladospora coralii TaxID=2771432 RepID=A0A926NAT7_9BACL|nr:SDR family oxidoreductase [Polycladospora coralii]MBD1373461.1 SDR family oxidoreductase [Polycladospora coralii]